MNTNAIAYCQCYSKAEAIQVQLCNRGTRCRRLWNHRCPCPLYGMYNPLLGIWLACFVSSGTYTKQLHWKNECWNGKALTLKFQSECSSIGVAADWSSRCDSLSYVTRVISKGLEVGVIYLKKVWWTEELLWAHELKHEFPSTQQQWQIYKIDLISCTVKVKKHQTRTCPFQATTSMLISLLKSKGHDKNELHF